MPRHSLVIPFFQEAGNALPLLVLARGTLDSLDGGCEVILVDDGSTDGTAEELAAAAAADSRCRVIRLERNAGQAAALYRGLREARGEIVLTMDGDGQNDPRDFPALLAVIGRGEADVACGWRVDRRDRWTRRISSRIANAVRRFVLRDGVHDAGCQLRVFRREVMAALRPTGMLQAFLPAMAASAGFRVREVPVRHHARRCGASKYGARNLSWRPSVELAAAWWRLRVMARRPGGQPRSRPG